MSPRLIEETCSCGASIRTNGTEYRRDTDPRNPRGAEEVVERWRTDHKHEMAPLFPELLDEQPVVPEVS